MRLWIAFATALIVVLATGEATSQRRIGNTRSDQTTTSGAGQTSRGERKAPAAQPSPGPVRYSPSPSPVRPPVNPAPPPRPPEQGLPFDGGVCIAGDSPAILATASVVTAREAVNTDVELFDCQRVPLYSGFDFSEGEVVPYTDQASDMYFAVEEGVCSMCVNDDTDIQDLGEASASGSSRKMPANGWSTSRTVPLKAGHAYAVWAWDGEYSRFRVIDMTDESVVFTWATVGSLSRKIDGPLFGR